MKIEYLNISDIEPYKNNPKMHDSSLVALATSIKRYGFNVPLVVNKKGVIITGHGRYLAAKKIGLKKLPCIVSGMPDKKAQQYRLADNKIFELSQNDPAAYEAELRDISTRGETELEEIGDIFEDIKTFAKKMSGVSYQSVTKTDVGDSKNEMHDKISDYASEPETIDIICEHCGEVFSVQRRDV